MLALLRPVHRARKILASPSKDGLVVCASAPACDAGASVLARGGNAVDAAVATAFALAVTHPIAGNIGGGGFMIVRTARGEATAFDYREKAPLAVDADDVPRRPGEDRRIVDETGYMAPGCRDRARARARAQALRQAAVEGHGHAGHRLAEQGFAIRRPRARTEQRSSAAMARYPASVSAYGKPGGGQWAAGDRLGCLGELARRFTRSPRRRRRVLQRSDRRPIAEDMRGERRLITEGGPGRYEAKERVPLRGTYRGFESSRCRRSAPAVWR